MAKSILEGKRILVVDDEPDILTVLEEEIGEACGTCEIDKATTYEEAAGLLASHAYDLVVLDIMGVRGFDLLEIAVKRNCRVAMLTAHALSAEALLKSHDLGAWAYLPKEKLKEIVPLLEDVLRYEFERGWKRLMVELEVFFDGRFGSDWRSKARLDGYYNLPGPQRATC
jgi:CheY-like chemotaxis protein